MHTLQHIYLGWLISSRGKYVYFDSFCGFYVSRVCWNSLVYSGFWYSIIHTPFNQSLYWKLHHTWTVFGVVLGCRGAYCAWYQFIETLLPCSFLWPCKSLLQTQEVLFKEYTCALKNDTVTQWWNTRWRSFNAFVSYWKHASLAFERMKPTSHRFTVCSAHIAHSIFTFSAQSQQKEHIHTIAHNLKSLTL